MRQTTAALGPGGVLLGKDPWEVGDYVNGGLHEGCAAENATVITLRNLTAHWQQMGKRGTRLIYQCHGKQNNTANEIAAFLVGAGGRPLLRVRQLGWRRQKRVEPPSGGDGQETRRA